MTYFLKQSTNWCGLALVGLVLFAPAARAAILEEFLFDDTNGTLLGSAFNSANNGNLWVEDTEDMTFSAVQNGVYRIQKDTAVTPSGFGTNFLQIDNITSGKAWIVAEIAGWSFSSIVGPDEFDSSQPEEIRFSFLDNDTGTSGSSNTAQIELQRNGAGGIELVGNESSGAGTNIPGAAALNLIQTDPFVAVLELDMDDNKYGVFYKDGDSPFQALGTADIDPNRAGNSIRFVANNSFAGTGEFFDIDRIYLTDESPLVEQLDALTLRVYSNGLMEIANDSSTPFDINSYRIASSTVDGDLNFDGWDSFSDQEIDAIDGPIDADSIVGNGIGETWDEAGGSSDKVLAESFLLGSSVFDPDRVETLGNAFQPGGDVDSLSFQYRSKTNGALFDGLVEFIAVAGVPGDYNGDGTVNAADYTVWKDNLGASITLQNEGPGITPGMVTPEDLAFWKSQFGNTTGAGANLAAIPEPASSLLLLMGAAVALLRTATPRRKKS